MEWIDGGVTSPKGFKASAVRAGLKKEGLDLAVLECPTEASSAGLFTSNAVKAAPVLLSTQNLRRSGGVTRAVVVNSGNANACTGNKGLKDAAKVAARCAELLRTSPEKVLLASTGVIGRPLPLGKVLAGLDLAIAKLSSSRAAAREAAQAIMTTDRVPKEATVTVRLHDDSFVIGGMAKGVGMIHPNLGTMLCLVTTDASIKPGPLGRALRRAADESFNMISVDRDTSTNDTVLVMASGQSRCRIPSAGAAFSLFREALTQVCISLAKQMVRDGEGATKIFEVEVSGAASRRDARLCARSIVGSNLVKSAFFGCDPNWGRILAAAGYSGAKIDQGLVGISLQSPDGRTMDWVAHGQQISEETNERARSFLASEAFTVRIDLGLGRFRATAWGCDLSYDYVKVNSQYTT